METKSPTIRPSSYKPGLQGPNHNPTIGQPLREQKAANDRWLSWK
ncbi:MAG TPA: hypothetical protein VFS97_11560 [Nitrososphaeraceae archaeon]|nr:hypothetical protein [Nitrososphaeraceae archaeon]